MRYRLHGKPAKYTLGSLQALDLPEARDKAREVLRGVAKGAAPAQAKADREAAGPLTFKAVADRYIEQYARPRKRTWKEDRRDIDRDLLPIWGKRTAAEIRRRDVLEVIDRKARTAPIRANRQLALLRKLFTWAAEKDLIPSSPVAGVKAPSKERSRDRVLSDVELAAFWRATDRLQWPWRDYFQFLCLSGQRRGEVANMRKSDLDRDARLWTLPAEAVKAGRVHDVPLSEPMEAILDGMLEFDGEYLFTTTDGAKPIQGFGKAKARLDRLMLEELRKVAGERGEDPEAVKLTAWSIHDLRRSAASHLAKIGFPVHVVGALLNHSPGSTAGITSVYIRHRYAAERRSALEAWANHLLGLVEDRPDNVVRFTA